jgi:hypothetical protein
MEHRVTVTILCRALVGANLTKANSIWSSLVFLFHAQNSANTALQIMQVLFSTTDNAGTFVTRDGIFKRNRFHRN